MNDDSWSLETLNDRGIRNYSQEAVTLSTRDLIYNIDRDFTDPTRWNNKFALPLIQNEYLFNKKRKKKRKVTITIPIVFTSEVRIEEIRSAWRREHRRGNLCQFVWTRRTRGSRGYTLGSRFWFVPSLYARRAWLHRLISYSRATSA